jgi:hypothetical protein
MTETKPSDQPNPVRPWGDIILRASAGVVLVGLAALWYFGEVHDDYKRADVHRYNAAVAVAHAVADGRAHEDGYQSLPPELLGMRESASVSTFTPVPIEQAEAAVAADTALASYYMAQVTETTTDARLLASGAGATALIGFGLLYPLVSVGVETATRSRSGQRKPVGSSGGTAT